MQLADNEYNYEIYDVMNFEIYIAVTRKTKTSIF